MRANLRDIAEAAASDPKRALLDRLDVSQIQVLHNLILVATFVTPPKRFKGPDGKDIDFHLPDNSLMEDRFQGKVGLVVAKGPLAFKDDANVKFGGVEVEVGDWVMYRPSDALELFLRDARSGHANEGIPCRLIEDTLVKGVVADPLTIY